MKQKAKLKLTSLSTMQRIIAAVIFGAALVVIVTLLPKPERSAANYCKVYKTETAKLTNANGSLKGVTSNAHDFALAYSRLDEVAPSDIESDVKTLKTIFHKIDKDPSQAFSASLSGVSAESQVKKWTASHCGS